MLLPRQTVWLVQVMRVLLIQQVAPFIIFRAPHRIAFFADERQRQAPVVAVVKMNFSRRCVFRLHLSGQLLHRQPALRKPLTAFTAHAVCPDFFLQSVQQPHQFSREHHTVAVLTPFLLERLCQAAPLRFFPLAVLCLDPDERREASRLVYRLDTCGVSLRTDDERTHHYHYDSQHRLVFYTRIQHGEPLVESRYLYDPLGRRMAKRVWRRERDLTGWMSLSRKPEVTWYGWDGDRLTTVQTDTTRIQTVYEPGSFTPLIRVETENGEREKAQRRSLAETLQQEGSENGHGVVFPAELVRLLDRLEEEIRADRVSSESRQWLAQCGLTVEQLARQVEPEYTPARKAHLYHCDHRGLPLALISEDGNTAWSAEYDEWGNQLNEENPHHVYQPYRLPGQQHDEESGLYYNRHRYYDPLQGRYITQDPMGLKGGWNLYQYPLNPLQQIDPMGLLQTWDDARSGACTGGVCGVLSRIIGPSKFDSTADAALDALKETQNRSLCNDMEYSGIVCKDTNGKYFASKAETDNLRKESYPLKRKCPTGTDRVAAYHTHGADSHGDYVDEFFSSSDKNLVRSKDNNLEAFYLATPDGRFEALNNKGEYIFIRNSVPGLSSVCIPYHD
ncbi:RhsD protein [Escherichia coli]|nr:RhsD protein [Escherichia coli]